jgi:hypothetical protein
MESLYLHTSRYSGVGEVVSNYLAVVAIKIVGTCVLVGDGFKRLKP